MADQAERIAAYEARRQALIEQERAADAAAIDGFERWLKNVRHTFDNAFLVVDELDAKLVVLRRD